MTIDPLLVVGLLMLGMALGALLMKIRCTNAMKKLVNDELLSAGQLRQNVAPEQRTA